MNANQSADRAKPQNQTGEDSGSIKRPQVTDDTVKGRDLARGSEGETRRSSQHRS